MLCQPVGPLPASIMIVGEAPGEEEAKLGVPFVGEAGKELSRMLQEAGIFRNQCFVTTVIKIRPPGNDIGVFIAERKKDITPKHVPFRDKMVLPVVVEGVELLKREIEACQPNVIIAVGNVAMWALTGKWGITSWRGSILDCDLPISCRPKVVPTYSPAAILQQWSWRAISVIDLKRAKTESAFPEIRKPDWKFLVRPGFIQTLNYLSWLLQLADGGKLALSVDLETRNGHIACIGLAPSYLEAICIPFMCVERDEGYWDLEEETEIVWLLYQLLTHPSVTIIGQNFLYDMQYIHKSWNFLPNKKVLDTMLMQHVLFCNLPKGLDFISSMYLEYYRYWKAEGKEWDAKTGEDQLWNYNCTDAVNTWECARIMLGIVEQMRLVEVNNFQQILIWPVLNAMLKGIATDHRLKGEFAYAVQKEIDKRHEWLTDVLGHDLNIKSPKQVKELFYEDLQQPKIFNRKTKELTTNEEALRKIAERQPVLRPVTNNILAQRSLGVFLSTFIGARTDDDGRMRCSYNIGGTETYRFSSSANAFGNGLNLQNIPSGDEEAELALPNIRRLFIPDPSKLFFDIDLSSADLRIVVWESDETEMKAMLREGYDPYTEIAKEFYHDPTIDKKDPRRQTFKSFAHGTHYLGTAKGLAERLGLNVAEAEKTQRWYFNRFPRIEQWQKNLKNQIFSKRMVQNIFGYRCYVFDRIEGTVMNELAAWIPQSTVACLINRAFVNIYNNLPEVDVLLQVHDSLAGQFPADREEFFIKAIVEQASITLPYPDPLVIPVGVKISKKSWGDCE